MNCLVTCQYQHAFQYHKARPRKLCHLACHPRIVNKRVVYGQQIGVVGKAYRNKWPTEAAYIDMIFCANSFINFPFICWFPLVSSNERKVNLSKADIFPLNSFTIVMALLLLKFERVRGKKSSGKELGSSVHYPEKKLQ